MVSEPTSTRTIEMTMATMGRFMKNFDMGLLHRPFRGKRLGVYVHARTHLLNPLGHDAFAGFHPFSDDPFGTDPVTDRHRANVHFAVAIHDSDLIAALQLGHRALRYKQSSVFDADNCANSGVAAGPQNVSGIRK